MIGVFLPTIFHVYLFTILFVLFGAIKSKSRFALYTAILMLIVPIVIAYLPNALVASKPDESTLNTFLKSDIFSLANMIAFVFNSFEPVKFNGVSTFGIKIQTFIAFVYTYHYLNWFSKTSIIGWKNALNAKSTILIIVIWVLAVSIYLYDFKTGFVALFFLSSMHVLMEFPLNILTIKELIKFTKKTVTSKIIS